MPILTNSIGIYTFVALSGEPITPVERVEVLTWPGIDYQRYRRSGKGSAPFSMISVVNVLDVDEGRLVLANYAGLATAGLQKLVYRDHDFDTDNLRAQVLNVRQLELTNIVQWCGSFDDTDKAKLVAEWTLSLKAT
jgi:hypothetical protein